MPKHNSAKNWLIEHIYSAQINFIECSWRLTDILAWSQVSHPEMRLVSAAIVTSFPFLRTFVHVGLNEKEIFPLLFPTWGNSYCCLKKSAKVSCRGFDPPTFRSTGRHSWATQTRQGFCMFPQSFDLRRETAGFFIVHAWCSECVHTLDLGLSSHPNDVRVSRSK
jgi:hypothetical protein